VTVGKIYNLPDALTMLAVIVGVGDIVGYLFKFIVVLVVIIPIVRA